MVFISSAGTSIESGWAYYFRILPDLSFVEVNPAATTCPIAYSFNMRCYMRETDA